MYNNSQFEETRAEVLHALLRSHPLAMLVTLTAQGLEANHIPLYLRTKGVDRRTLVGKWKVSQNQSEANQATVQQGLQGRGTEAATEMAGLVKTYGVNATKG